MRTVFRIVVRVAPPLAVALLYCDLLTSPFVARMGVSVTGRTDSASLPPYEVIRLTDQSDARFNKGEYKDALRPALRLYRSYPENAVYIKRLAEIYDRLGRYADEAGMWEQFLQHAPVPQEGCPQIGKAYQHQGKNKEAIDAFERCLAFNTTDPDALFFLAHALEIVQQYDRANDLYGQCLDVAPSNSDCQVGVARILLRTGHSKEAARAAANVLARLPNQTDALLVMALIRWG